MMHARELKRKGHYAEADEEMWKAVEYYRRRNPSPSTYVLREMARLRIAAGEYQEARRFALHHLEVNRQFSGWFRYGFIAGLNISSPVGSFDSHTMLGLISLREGDRAKAIEHLYQSAGGIIIGGFSFRDFTFGFEEVQLAAELLALGENGPVLEFLERVRRAYASSLDARGQGFFFNISWEDYYENSAKARMHAEKLDRWRQEILAGGAPKDWEELLEANRPAAKGGPGKLRPMESLLSELPKPPSGWSGILPPCAFLCGGWILAGFAARRSASLPLPATRRIVTLAAVRIMACALFAGTFLIEGFVASGGVIYLLTVAGWWLLWAFLQILAPGIVTRRESRIFRFLVLASMFLPLALLVFTYLLKDDWNYRVLVIGLSLTSLLVLAMVLSVCGFFIFRLWKWKSADHLRPLKTALLISTPLVLLYAFAIVTAAITQEMYPARGVFLLWADAFFPWVLATGIFLTKQASPLSANPATAG
jgi:tetratricopeptide (TPR) repeat protein